ncbi:MAG: sulfite exporter TauE/SafE family protein [Clostridiales bacterium]|nr:sulfite exporter TauE/SafE family protein [Clostridiales bacterium]
MNLSLLLPALATAVTVGLGCGTCCSPIVSTFLSTYVISHSGGVKRGVFSFVSFFMGKVASVSLLCTISAIVSSSFISDSGYIGSFNLRLFSQIAMSSVGVLLTIRWFLELKKQKKCSDCKACEKPVEKSGTVPMLAAGFTYGMTPCAPLLLMIGYCFTLPVPLAGVTGIVFGLSTMISPALLLVMVTGALSAKMRKEIPHMVRWFRLASYVLLMVVPFFLTSWY